MPTKYDPGAQMGEIGIAYIRSTVTTAGLIYRPFENSDVGVDGAANCRERSYLVPSRRSCESVDLENRHRG